MKKIILLIVLAILSFNSIKANEAKIISNPYVQTQILKTVFPSLLNSTHANWYKKDSTKIIFDFIKSNKIFINGDNFNTVYKVKTKKYIKYDKVEEYDMKGVDSNNNKCDIQVLYFDDNCVLMTVLNDTSVIRYKYLKNS